MSKIIKIPSERYIALYYVLLRIGKAAHILQIPFRENINSSVEAFLKDPRTEKLERIVFHEMKSIKRAKEIIESEDIKSNGIVKVDDLLYSYAKAEIVYIDREFTFIINEPKDYTRKKLILLLFDPGLDERGQKLICKLDEKTNELDKSAEYKKVKKALGKMKFYHEDESQILDDILTIYRNM